MKFLTVKQLEEEFKMPAPTQKMWRQSGKFKEGRDFVKVGNTVAYKPKAIRTHKLLKEYVEKKETA